MINPHYLYNKIYSLVTKILKIVVAKKYRENILLYILFFS